MIPQPVSDTEPAFLPQSGLFCQNGWSLILSCPCSPLSESAPPPLTSNVMNSSRYVSSTRSPNLLENIVRAQGSRFQPQTGPVLDSENKNCKPLALASYPPGIYHKEVGIQICSIYSVYRHLMLNVYTHDFCFL